MGRKNFDILKDTPCTKFGSVGKLISVKNDESALEYSTNPWFELMASKLNLVGKAGKFLRVNETEDALVFDDYEITLFDDPVPIGNGVSYLKSGIDTGFRLANTVDIEFWYYYADTQNWSQNIGLWEVNNNNANWVKMGIIKNTTTLYLTVKVNGVNSGINLTSFFNYLGWFHIRMVWYGTYCKIYKNGALHQELSLPDLNTMVGAGATLYLWNTYTGEIPIPSGHSLIHFRYIRNEMFTAHYIVCEESGNTIYNAVGNFKHLTGQNGFDSIVWTRINNQFRHLGNYGYRKSGSVYIPGLLTGSGASDGNPLTVQPRAFNNEFRHDDLYGLIDMGITYQGYILLNSLPIITGNKIIKFSLYLDHNGGYYGGTWGHVLFYFSDGVNSLDWLYISLYNNTCRIYVTSNSSGNKYFSLVGLQRQQLDIVITKTTGVVSSVTINGTPVSLDTLSGLTSGSAEKKIHVGTSGTIGRFKLWNFIIESGGVETLNIAGRPNGNNNSAWIDTVGGNNGTVSSIAYLTHIPVISPEGTIVDIDGNVYTSVIIGNQEWLVEDLKTTRYKDGTPITNIIDNDAWNTDIIGAYCWYNNNINYKIPYGALYNWYAVNNIHGLAPNGWRIPTVIDYVTLSTFLGGDSVAGGKLKEIGLSHWQTPNAGATDLYGFKALPGGARTEGGIFVAIYQYNCLWTATSADINQAYERWMNYQNTIFLDSGGGKIRGYSVRCMRNI